jgi:outer membrane protein assembly factor BamB
LGKPTWGFSGSPLVQGNRVILNLGAVVALDKMTGAELWRTANLDAAYATPAIFDDAGRDLLAIHGQKSGLALVDPRDGAVATSFTYTSSVMVSTPLIQGNRILVTASEKIDAHLLELTGGRLASRWSSKAIQSWLSTPVIDQGHAYGFHENALCCVDLVDGRTRWEQPGIGEGALTRAGDKLLVQSGDGALLIVDASLEGYRERARQKVFRSRSWVAPVLCNGMVYCRSNAGRVVCLMVR